MSSAAEIRGTGEYDHAVSARRVTVFGGTGFLGSCLARHLCNAGFTLRIASRHPDRAGSISRDDSAIESVYCDINYDASVAAAISETWAVVNAVSLYVEHGHHTFHSVHVEAAERVATLARLGGIERIAHVSGVGSCALLSSSYVASRGEGESAVLRAFPSAIIIRPTVMFGPGDAFLTPLLNLLQRMPVFPMFGRGETMLQPVLVEDVADAIVRILRTPAPHVVYELAGPHVYTYEALLRTIAGSVDKKPLLLPFPFFLWRVIGFACEFLPRPPITRNQVELMQIDNVAAPGAPGFDELQISPRPIEDLLPQILRETRDAADKPRKH
jgi:NADH dehydrogenase